MTVYFLLATACSTSPTDTIVTVKGIVTKVHDGDSIHITPTNRKRVIIRFSALDAPELEQPSGIASRDKLRSLLMGKQATARCHKTDRYQRNVCNVFLEEQDIGLVMLQSGHAWHYKQYQNEQTTRMRKQYHQAEIKARKNRAGLWANPEPIPPWVFRKSARGS